MEAQRLAPKATYGVVAWRHRAGRDIVDAVAGGFGVAEEVITAIPPRDIRAGGEGGLADEVAHAAASFVLNH